jgi:hypothetical protein
MKSVIGWLATCGDALDEHGDCPDSEEHGDFVNSENHQQRGESSERAEW